MGSALQFLAIIAIATWLASRGAGAVAKGVLGLVLLWIMKWLLIGTALIGIAMLTAGRP